MTNLTEAKLAREAELCHATLALVTDYDCWHETEDAVSVGAILEIMRKNVETAKQVLHHALKLVKSAKPCTCQMALDHAMITPLARMSPTLKKRYQVLLHRKLSTTRQTKKR